MSMRFLQFWLATDFIILITDAFTKTENLGINLLLDVSMIGFVLYLMWTQKKIDSMNF